MKKIVIAAKFSLMITITVAIQFPMVLKALYIFSKNNKKTVDNFHCSYFFKKNANIF